MSSTLSQIEGLKHKLVVSVSETAFKQAYKKHLSEIARTANIKGFRPGKVPTNILEQKFGRGLLQESAVELIRKSFEDEVKLQNIKMAGLPNIDFDTNSLEKNKPFEFTATFDVYPDIQLKDLSGITLEKAEGEVTDADVENMLVKIRAQHADWHAVDRAAKLGDRLTIDFDGLMDGKPLERGSAKGMFLELGSHTMIAGFEEGLMGAKKDEMKALSLSFPKDYHVEALKGKPVEFTVMIHKIEEPILPALDDAFAKKVGASTGLAELKQLLKTRMQNELNDMAHQMLKNSIFDKLMDLNTIMIPQSLIEMEIRQLQNNMRQRMKSINPKMTDTQLQSLPLSRDLFAEEARKRVLLGLLLAEVIKANKMMLDENRVQQQFAKMAANAANPEETISAYNKNQHIRSDVEAFVLEEQAAEILLKTATVVTVNKNYDAIMNVASGAKTEPRA